MKQQQLILTDLNELTVFDVYSGLLNNYRGNCMPTSLLRVQFTVFNIQPLIDDNVRLTIIVHFSNQANPVSV